MLLRARACAQLSTAQEKSLDKFLGGGLCQPEFVTNHVASGLRIFLSLVSNPGNSGGPILDAGGRVVGLLEGNLLTPVTKDRQGTKYLAYCGLAPIGPDGRPNLDSAGNPPPPPAPCLQNSGISFAIPARSIAELAKKNNINLE